MGRWSDAVVACFVVTASVSRRKGRWGACIDKEFWFSLAETLFPSWRANRLSFPAKAHSRIALARQSQKLSCSEARNEKSNQNRKIPVRSSRADGHEGQRKLQCAVQPIAQHPRRCHVKAEAPLIPLSCYSLCATVTSIHHQLPKRTNITTCATAGTIQPITKQT